MVFVKSSGRDWFVESQFCQLNYRISLESLKKLAARVLAGVKTLGSCTRLLSLLKHNCLFTYRVIFGGDPADVITVCVEWKTVVRKSIYK